MNGRKYGHNYARKTHGFNLRSTMFPVSYYAPRAFPRLHEQMWDNLIGRLKKMVCAGSPIRLWTGDGHLSRKIDWGKTLGWWEADREDE